MKKIFKKLILLGISASFLFGSLANADEAYEIRDIQEIEVSGENHIYLADKKEIADALAGAVAAIENNGRLLMVDSDNLTEEEQIKIQNADELSLIGGRLRLSEELEHNENFKERISGVDRYETAVKIANYLGNDRDIIVVNGDNYVDAITTSPLGIMENRNIILVNENFVPKATRSYLLEYCQGKDIIFVGGEKSLPLEIREEVFRLTGNYGSVEDNTIAGEDRYSTCLKLAKRIGYENIILSYGEDYSSALNAMNYINDLKASVLLVNQDNIDEIVNGYYGDDKFGDIYSLGVQMTSNSELDLSDSEFPEELDSESIEEVEVAGSTETEITVQNFINSAIAMEGWAYSQSLRMSDGYADCSSLVLKALINSGLTGDHSNLTSETIWSDSRFYQISYDNLQPGDICYTYGHLAIYLGDNTVFEAKDWGIPAGYGNFQGRFNSFFRING
ncbi:MAG: cell wall-binding repeat-containing protein [Tissierellia bacterium]|nr:cell wall-binding repeat-containing protein [Tissierellia bacterium]